MNTRFGLPGCDVRWDAMNPRIGMGGIDMPWSEYEICLDKI